MSEIVRIAGVIRQSIVDGPGLRFVVFTQGCPHACPGCHNPATHDFAGGYDCPVSELLAAYDANPLLRGLTLSGGEPFCRAEALLPLAEGIRGRGGDIWCYSGYTLEELLEMGERDEAVARLLRRIDVLVDGPFIQAEKSLSLPFRGSRNQRVLDVPASIDAGNAIVYSPAEGGGIHKK